LDHPGGVIDVMSIFQDGGCGVANLLAVTISIHSWDITTSGLWKQMEL